MFISTGLNTSVMTRVDTGDLSDFDWIAQYRPQLLKHSADIDMSEIKRTKLKYFIAGELLQGENGYRRNDKALVSKTIVTLDYDGLVMTEKEFLEHVTDRLNTYRFMMYPTPSHTDGSLHYRVLVETSRPYREVENKRLTTEIIQLIGLPCDGASKTWSQLMGLPIVWDDPSHDPRLINRKGQPYAIKERNRIKLWPIEKHHKSGLIPENESDRIFDSYMEREDAALDEYTNALACLSRLAKSVQNQQITKETAQRYAKKLAKGNVKWIKGNLSKLDALIESDLKTEYDFYEAFDREDWTKQLARTNKGVIVQHMSNLILIIKNHPTIKDMLKWNNFALRVEKNHKAPWEDKYSVEWSDDDATQLRYYLVQEYGVDFPKDSVYTVVLSVAKERPHHPIKEWIESNPWDGTQRAETLFIDYLGAEDDEYIRAVAKTWLTGAVKRIYDPGCKFELVPVLQGKQGRGKSTLANALGGEWFTDSLKDMKSKDSKEFMRGAWIIELSELSAMKKTEIEDIKSFISATVDRYRPSYGRLTTDYPRTSVFIATTNDMSYLKDLTGSRRFAPVMIDEGKRHKDVFTISGSDIQQIWVEALTWYKQGQPVHLSAKIEKMADEYRERAQEDSPVKDAIQDYLNYKLPRTWYNMQLSERIHYIQDRMKNKPYKPSDDLIRTRVTTREIMTELFNHDPLDELRGNTEVKKVSLIMQNMPGWKYRVTRLNGQMFKGYFKEEG